MEDPLALVVEDDPRTQKVRKQQLEDRGWRVIVVGSKKEAVTELDACPEVDAILADANLDTSRPDDQSGVDLARIVRDRFGQIPIMAYSARVADRPLSRGEEKLFTYSVPKRIMRSAEVDQHLTLLFEDAQRHRARRAQESMERQAELRHHYRLETVDPAETVRRLMPHAVAAAGIEESLRTAGYHLQLVHSPAFRASASPVLVWVKEGEDGAEAEVYGQSTLYAHGDDANDAVAHLVDLMRLFAKDFRASEGEDIGPALRLRTFLERTIPLDEPG